MKIRKAHKAYSNRMWKRLMQKRWEGFSGWDDKERITNADLKRRIRAKLNGDETDLVDIGNLAMMLWHRKSQDTP